MPKFNSYKEERDYYLKRINLLKNKDKFDNNDIQLLINIVSHLIIKSYERDINLEESEELHDKIMNEMSEFDFN